MTVRGEGEQQEQEEIEDEEEEDETRAVKTISDTTTTYLESSASAGTVVKDSELDVCLSPLPSSESGCGGGLLGSSCKTSKLLSRVLIGADKVEIFGSIHIRSNNIRLLSCLIDEQMSIDNASEFKSLAYSSTSSSISSSSSSSSSSSYSSDGLAGLSKLFLFAQHHKQSKLLTNPNASIKSKKQEKKFLEQEAQKLLQEVQLKSVSLFFFSQIIIYF